MAVTGGVISEMPVIKGAVVPAPGSSGTTTWQETWKDNVLQIARDDLGLEVVNGLLCAVYGGEDE